MLRHAPSKANLLQPLKSVSILTNGSTVDVIDPGVPPPRPIKAGLSIVNNFTFKHSDRVGGREVSKPHKSFTIEAKSINSHLESRPHCMRVILFNSTLSIVLAGHLYSKSNRFCPGRTPWTYLVLCTLQLRWLLHQPSRTLISQELTRSLHT